MVGLRAIVLRGAAFAGIALAVLAACSGGGGGGPYNNPYPYQNPTQSPTGSPTNSPTSQPTGCATSTAPPASGAAVFYLAPSCSTASSDTGFTVPGDANGTIVLASTVDESEPLSPGAEQSAPPATTIEVAVAAGEATSALKRRAAAHGRITSNHPRGRAPRVAFNHRVRHARALPERKLAAVLASAHRGGAARAARKRAVLPTTVGSTDQIWTLDQTASGVNYVQVPSTLEYTSAHADVWVDNTLLAANGGPLTATAIQKIGTDYDDAYGAVQPVIGSPDYTGSSIGAQETTDCTGNTTPIFIDDAADRQALFVISSATNGNFGSYFDPANLVDQDVATTCLGDESNEAAGLYVQYNVGSGADSQSMQLGEDDLVLGANDLSHLIDFVGHTIVNPGSNDQTYLQTGYIDSPFIIEGLASLSEDLAVHAVYPNVKNDVDDNLSSAATYLSAPDAYGLTPFFGTDAGSPAEQGCDGCFGVAYLFARYNYERFGANYPTAIVGSGLTGFANLANAFGATTSPQNVIADFATAMQASGEGYTTDSRFNVAGFTTYGTFDDQFGNSLTLSGPAISATQSAGSDTDYSVSLGSFMYVGLSGLPASETITTTDGSNGAFGLETALSQH